jgi:hypothetical protein
MPFDRSPSVLRPASPLVTPTPPLGKKVIVDRALTPGSDFRVPGRNERGDIDRLESLAAIE